MARLASIAPALQQPGFTLLEMLIVIAILAMVATSIPFMSRGSGIELRGLGHELATELRGLREAAIRNHAVTEFTLEPQTGSYQLGSEEVALPPGVTVTYVVSEPPLIGDAPEHLAFYPDGSSTGGTITLTRSGALVTLSIGWMDGRISING
jgi:general secretion pathway protein H